MISSVYEVVVVQSKVAAFLCAYMRERVILRMLKHSLNPCLRIPIVDAL